ncbi:TAP42-like family protein [Xylariaceae sp. FL0255]|nr:TAP42-like family protein [Xylariaceae sp. FL0255]
MAEESRTLRSVFKAAEQKRLAIEGSYEMGSSGIQDDLAAAIKMYEECLEVIDKIALFSSNEDLEDLATADMPYLLVRYRIADLLQRLSIPSPVDRQNTLDKTREAYVKFLFGLEEYSILTAKQCTLLAEYIEDPTGFTTISTTDPNARRNAKIANFKAEKSLKERLAFMRGNPQYLEGGGDEDAVRDAYLAEMELCSHMAFQSLEGINREMEVLKQAPVPLIPFQSMVDVEEDQRRRRESIDNDGFSERLDAPLRTPSTNSGPLLSQQGKPLRPFTLVGNRQDLQRGVFRPGHNLPTMSIDEYLDEEKRRGNMIEGGGAASGMKPEPDEDNMELADAETMKAREWDEFTEANPKGSGNTLNRG